MVFVYLLFSVFRIFSWYFILFSVEISFWEMRIEGVIGIDVRVVAQRRDAERRLGGAGRVQGLSRAVQDRSRRRGNGREGGRFYGEFAITELVEFSFGRDGVQKERFDLIRLFLNKRIYVGQDKEYTVKSDEFIYVLLCVVCLKFYLFFG